MLGFHPFATQSFSENAPFVDVLTTTNVITSAISSAVIESSALVSVTTVGLINSATGTVGVVGNASITMTGVNATFTLISSLTPFTWTNISDTVGESWGAISTTGSSESWTEVEDDSTNEATTWTDA